MRTYVERTLVAPVSPVVAWDHLARVTDWPSWAPHIRRIEIDPPGALGPASRGAIHLRAAPTTTFRMVSFDPPHAWAWEGPLLTLTIHYDHRFEALPDGTTRISFVVSAGGPGSSILGPIFAKAYARSLDRAIPNLARQLALQASGSMAKPMNGSPATVERMIGPADGPSTS
jgi:hypothetical protein